jgi:hypothetical protein
MTKSHFQKDWWAEALVNKGLVEVGVSWWDADGRKAAEQHDVPSDFSAAHLRQVLGTNALILLPSHYFACYAKTTWSRLIKATDLSVTSAVFSHGGRHVEARVRFNLHKAYRIKSAAEAEVLGAVMAEWEAFAARHPGQATSVRITAEAAPGTLTIGRAVHPKQVESLTAQTEFDQAMARLVDSAPLREWAERIRRGRRSVYGFQVSEEAWVGQDNPTFAWWMAKCEARAPAMPSDLQ